MKTDTASARITNMEIKDQTKCFKKKLAHRRKCEFKIAKIE